ncbi:MAG TPA: NUDIX hydrolase [Rubricoccaceae bacterium]|nr:NUDIX hydrolase [Rubricoccaceae bacterium]
MSDPRPAPIPTEDQVSAGGVAFRRGARGVEVAVVKMKPKGRWQLPKGIVDAGETPEATALREVREEAGIEAALVAPLDVIEYWYVGRRGAGRVRFRKRVHFFLLAYRAGDVRDHDHEVEEARWVPVEEAEALLAFENERRVVAQARALIAAEAP